MRSGVGVGCGGIVGCCIGSRGDVVGGGGGCVGYGDGGGLEGGCVIVGIVFGGVWGRRCFCGGYGSCCGCGECGFG